MEEMTYSQMLEAPTEIKILWAASMTNRPVGAGFYQETVEKYPDYFPEEIERRRKWEAIPQEVHDKYYEECAEVRREKAPNPGFMYWIHHPDELEKYSEHTRAEIDQEQLIFNRIYGPFLK